MITDIKSSGSELQNLKHRNPLGKKVLIVDDEKLVINALKRGLQITGYEVLYSYDSLEAEAHLAKSKPDLLIVDLALIGKNGIDLIRTIKNEASTKNIPIIVYSGFLDNARKDLMDLKVDRMISKPTDLSEIVDVADELLGIKSS